MTEQQTPDREKKIAEIREALEKATPGPWFAVKVDSDSYSISNKPGYYGHSITGWGKVLQTKEDAHLIANAPEWLRFLLSELERLEREYAEERAAHNAHVTELCELERKDEVIEEQKRELFYKSKEITELREILWQDQQWFKQMSANITEMQKELDRIQQENRKLREERDNLQQAYDDAEMRASDAIAERNDAQQEIERLREERDKLIEGLRWYADEENQKLDESTRHWENVYSPYEMDGGQRARDILKEIGVTDV